MQTPAEPAPRRAQIVTLTMNPALDITTSIGIVRPTENATQRVATQAAASTSPGSLGGSVSAVPVRPSGASADVLRAGALSRPTADGSGVGRIRRGERQPAAGPTC